MEGNDPADHPNSLPSNGNLGSLRRVLIVGATGVFGQRLATMLAAMPGIDLILAARRLDRLERLRNSLQVNLAGTRLSVLAFDRGRPEALAQCDPWLVVDAAGPFQGSAYDLAYAAVAAGAHYVDLADSRAFVAGFAAALDAPARAAGVLAVTGASSTPALSHAAVAHLTEGWRQIDEILVAISPGARAPAGRSVVQAILSYVGRPVRVFRDGVWGEVPGWSGLRRLEMPGLGRRWVSICETPDLDLLPQTFAVRRTALFKAGLELAPMHLGLSALAWLVRLRLLASLRPLAGPLRTIARLLGPFGSDHGGMTADVRGVDADGAPIHARWALWAAANAGPNTPAAPAAAQIRALLDGRRFRPGAAPCTGTLRLDKILRELDHLPITTRVDESHTAHPALFHRLLGRRFADLPGPVRRVHAGLDRATFRGEAIARSGRGAAARILRWVLGLPPSGRSPVEVDIAPDARGEIWTRRFGRFRFASRLLPTGRLGIFEERLGPLRFTFHLRPTPRGVVWTMVGWSVVGLPLPLRLAPRMHARSEAAGGRYRFSVAVRHPWTGLLFAYRGLLDLGSEPTEL